MGGRDYIPEHQSAVTETNVALKILSGGAAEGLVAALARDFKAQTGLGIDGSFGAVGVQRDKFLAGEAADLLILTGPIIADFAARGLIDADTVTDIGVVKTGVAVRAADPMPPLTSAEDLRNALLATSKEFGKVNAVLKKFTQGVAVDRKKTTCC